VQLAATSANQRPLAHGLHYKSSVLPKKGHSGLTRARVKISKGDLPKTRFWKFRFMPKPPKNSVRVRFGGDKREQCLKDYSV